MLLQLSQLGVRGKIRRKTKIAIFAGGLIVFLLSLSFFGRWYDSIDSPPALPPFTTTVDLENRRIATRPLTTLPLVTFKSRFEHLLFFIAGLSQYADISGAFHPRIYYVLITPGMRAEEVASLFAQKLSWGKEERRQFLSALEEYSGVVLEGFHFPGLYTVRAGEHPEEVAKKILFRFEREVVSRYTTSTRELVPMHMALTLASLVEREARGVDDMPLVAGVFWNRYFADKRLESDVTLQYIKGRDGAWWPRVTPRDKFLSSPYNTYRNEGLPPTPIATPSVDAIIAALNPEKTDCFFFLHDTKGDVYCSETYEEHQKNIDKYLK